MRSTLDARQSTPSAPPAPTVPVDVRLRGRAAVRLLWLTVCSVLLVILCTCSLAFGVREVSIGEILAALAGRIDSAGEAAVVARIPRTALAILVGAALALAGCAFQAVTRNPLADPGIMGVLNGSALAVVAGLAFLGLSDPYSQIGLAVAGAALAAVFVYVAGSLGRGGATPLKLALAGAATAAACVSLVNAILLPRVDTMTAFRFWQIGGVGGATWDRIAVIAPVLALGALLVALSARGMNALALGDDLAAGLGERVGRTRVIASLGAVILCGAATAVAGPIAFVGLLVPHLCRLLIGTEHRWLLPLSAIIGANLLVAADTLGRVIARPVEIEVGIVTAVLGAPLLIAIVRRRKVRDL